MWNCSQLDLQIILSNQVTISQQCYWVPAIREGADISMINNTKTWQLTPKTDQIDENNPMCMRQNVFW